MTGLTAATASSDATAPSSTITSPAANAQIAPGTQVTVSGTATDSGGVVGGVEVSTDGGTTLAPRDRARHLDLHMGGRELGYRHDPQPRGGRQRQPRVAEGGRHGHGRLRQPELSVHDLAEQYDARARVRERQRRARGGREVPRRRRRPHHRSALLQGCGQHRHARRPPVDAYRHAARHRHVHAARPPPAGSRSTSPRRWRSPPTRPTSPPTTRRMATTRSTRTTSRPAASTAPPLHALTRRRRRRQRPLRLRAERRLPDRRLPNRELLGRRRLRHGLRAAARGDTTPPTVAVDHAGRRRDRDRRQRERHRDRSASRWAPTTHHHARTSSSGPRRQRAWRRP